MIACTVLLTLPAPSHAAGLSDQLIESVPMGEDDERLDYVITPEGTLAYTSAADAAHAAALMEGTRKRERLAEEAEQPSANAEGSASSLNSDERVDLSSGRWKYACLRLSKPSEPSMIAVRRWAAPVCTCSGSGHRLPPPHRHLSGVHPPDWSDRCSACRSQRSR